MFRDCLRRMTSNAINSVPATIRMISGRNRRYSTAAGARLMGTRHLDVGRRRGGRLHANLHVYLRLIQNVSRSLTHGWQERLRIHSHPNHHRDQRHDGGPFARLQIEDMMAHLVRRLAEEHSLVKPQHVTSRKDDADGGENRPAEIGLRGTLQYQELADEVTQ